MRRRDGSSTVLRSRQGSQALVEFGIVAILFVMILFAIVDFGLLLNGWMTVNAGAREAARTGAAGSSVVSVLSAARRYAPPGVTTSELKVAANYCPPAGDSRGRCLGYTDGPMPTPYPCSAGSAGPSQVCTDPPDPVDPDPWPTYDPVLNFYGVKSGDTVTVFVVADTFQVVTPLVRPFFGCDGARPDCPVALVGTAAMRYEGPPPP